MILRKQLRFSSKITNSCKRTFCSQSKYIENSVAYKEDGVMTAEMERVICVLNSFRERNWISLNPEDIELMAGTILSIQDGKSLNLNNKDFDLEEWNKIKDRANEFINKGEEASHHLYIGNHKCAMKLAAYGETHSKEAQNVKKLEGIRDRSIARGSYRVPMVHNQETKDACFFEAISKTNMTQAERKVYDEIQSLKR